jgi:hypothetical protein
MFRSKKRYGKLAAPSTQAVMAQHVALLAQSHARVRRAARSTRTATTTSTKSTTSAAAAAAAAGTVVEEEINDNDYADNSGDVLLSKLASTQSRRAVAVAAAAPTSAATSLKNFLVRTATRLVEAFVPAQPRTQQSGSVTVDVDDASDDADGDAASDVAINASPAALSQLTIDDMQPEVADVATQMLPPPRQPARPATQRSSVDVPQPQPPARTSQETLAPSSSQARKSALRQCVIENVAENHATTDETSTATASQRVRLVRFATSPIATRAPAIIDLVTSPQTSPVHARQPVNVPSPIAIASITTATTADDDVERDAGAATQQTLRLPQRFLRRDWFVQGRLVLHTNCARHAGGSVRVLVMEMTTTTTTTTTMMVVPQRASRDVGNIMALTATTAMTMTGHVRHCQNCRPREHLCRRRQADISHTRARQHRRRHHRSSTPASCRKRRRRRRCRRCAWASGSASVTRVDHAAPSSNLTATQATSSRTRSTRGLTCSRRRR